MTDPEILSRFRKQGSLPEGSAAIYDLDSATPSAVLSDTGYQIVNHILACLVDKTALPANIKQFTPTLYYPSTLHLLGLSFIAARQPECL